MMSLAAAAGALKKWDGGRSSRGRSLGRGLNQKPKTGEGLKYRCKSVQFGAFWGHQVIKSGTENRY